VRGAAASCCYRNQWTGGGPGARSTPPEAQTPRLLRPQRQAGRSGRGAERRRRADPVLRVSEDLDSFEATTDIDVTSPARPWLGIIRLSDDAALDWHCDWQTAFQRNPAAFIAMITPILCAH
jgi:hypothetical protein